MDYVKLDGVGSFDIPDVQACSTALKQTGRPMALELSSSLNINDATTWLSLANSRRTTGDIECYCGSDGSSYPLTHWAVDRDGIPADRVFDSTSTGTFTVQPGGVTLISATPTSGTGTGLLTPRWFSAHYCRNPMYVTPIHAHGCTCERSHRCAPISAVEVYQA